MIYEGGGYLQGSIGEWGSFTTCERFDPVAVKFSTGGSFTHFCSIGFEYIFNIGSFKYFSASVNVTEGAPDLVKLII